MADGNIKLYGKLKSVTEEGKVADYSEIAGVPITTQDLSASGFTPTANTYYLHTGETTIAYDNGMIYFYNGTNYTSIIGGGLSNDFGLTQGDQKYSIVQKRIKSDGSTVTAKAYQRGTIALGGGTVAGDPSGSPTAYSFAFAANENNEAIARSSAAFGRYNKTFNPGEFVCGNYAEENRNKATVFLVGGGYSPTRRHNAFEVRVDHTDGDVTTALIDGKTIANMDWVEDYAVRRERHRRHVVYVVSDEPTTLVTDTISYKSGEEAAKGTGNWFQLMENGRMYCEGPSDSDSIYQVSNKGYVDRKWENFGLATGDTPYSVVQQVMGQDGVMIKNHTYQRGGIAVGSGTVAGDINGDVNAYSYAFAANENNKAIARSSVAFGRYNTAYNIGEFVCGNYAEENRNEATVFVVGGGVSPTRRHNAFEVRSDHSIPGVYRSKAFVDGKALATEEYASSIHKHEIASTGFATRLVVYNTNSKEITKFSDLLNDEYISMYIESSHQNPVIAIYAAISGNNYIGIKVRFYADFTTTTYAEYLDNNLVNDIVTEL